MDSLDIILHSMADETVRKQHLMLGGYENRFDEETVRRVSQFSKELWDKRRYDKFTLFPAENDNMIIAQDLRLFSFCEHHLLPFYGIVNIGYIPSEKIFGLSKLQRVVDKFASMPTLQERLTQEIIDFIWKTIQPKGVIVQCKAIHTCIVARGTNSTNAQYTTSAVYGNFKEAPIRAEFLQTLQSNQSLRLL
jgi:GTP cyclohydrolase I